ncbi:hypothetical protein BHM03_00059742 [Ensete ventricosum]|uniref:Reticulon domain-containing protein n=1 Tax=Ensete ventricosum TaxID=4639 RepID=A0A445MMP2_ENSVE|nr:hypothetical protein BHM03_00059742 [Ensete ventricosum]
MTCTVECGVRSVSPSSYHLPFLATHRPPIPVGVGPTASSWLTASRARRACLLYSLGQLSPSTWCHVTGGPEMASGTAPQAGRAGHAKFLSEAATMAEHKEESVGESLMEKITEKFHGGDSSSSDSDGEKSSLVGSSTPPPSAAEVVKAKIYRLFGREKPVHKVLGGGKRTDQVSVPEDLTVNIALSLRYEINWALAALRDIALGRDLKKFLSKYEDKVDAFAEKAQTEFKKHYSVVHAKYLSKIPKGPLKDKKFQ